MPSSIPPAHGGTSAPEARTRTVGERRDGTEPDAGNASAAAPVLEVFASVQGEGAFAGELQAFVRLAGCPLRCRYCDTPGSWVIDAERPPRIAVPPGNQPREREPAYATPFQAACWIAAVEPGMPRTVSVTGGEPLLHPAFVERLAEFVAPRRVHLETSGVPFDALARVVDRVDHVSLDLKAAGDLDAPVALAAHGGAALPRTPREWAAAHRQALALVRGRDACAKLVLVGGRALADYATLLDEVAEHAPELPVYVQPATPMRGLAPPARELIEDVAEAALARELRVRVMPQMHRALRLP